MKLHRVKTRKYADYLQEIDPRGRVWHVGDEYTMYYDEGVLNIIQQPVQKWTSKTKK